MGDRLSCRFAPSSGYGRQTSGAYCSRLVRIEFDAIEAGVPLHGLNGCLDTHLLHRLAENIRPKHSVDKPV